LRDMVGADESGAEVLAAHRFAESPALPLR
jgi:hypothetical protein